MPNEHAIQFLAHNMTVAEFASEAGRERHTVADWRKRGMLEGYGQPHPNREGAWVYSQEDVLRVYIAEMLQERGGLTWATALEAAKIVGSVLVGRAIYDSDTYNGRFIFIFETSKGVLGFWGLPTEDAFAALPLGISSPLIARVVEVDDIANNLPGDVRARLEILAN